MDGTKQVVVIGKNGLRGILLPMTNPAQSGQHQALLQLETGQHLVVPFEILQAQADGSYQLPFNLAELEQRFAIQADQQNQQTLVLPVIAEELEIQKRQVVSGGVRVRKTVHEHEEVVDQPLLREEVKVERVAINQVVSQPPVTRYEGDTMIVPVLEEVIVVEKRLILKEELRITKRQATVSQPQSVTLRTEEVSVEQIAPDTQRSQPTGSI